MSSAQASPGANSKNNKKNSVFIICIVQLIVSCIRRQLVALKKLEMFSWSAQVRTLATVEGARATHLAEAVWRNPAATVPLVIGTGVMWERA
jgi:hypothetical protein